MFETKNVVSVWGCGGSRQSESISISKNKVFLHYFKGVTGVHLDITIVLLSQSLFENKNKVCVGV